MEMNDDIEIWVGKRNAGNGAYDNTICCVD